MPNNSVPEKPAQEAPGAAALKFETWVLKVFIHCQGCKKKVKKVLQNIDGVYTTEIDSQQHKVTVIGNIDAQTLIKKLEKSGKHVELWPQPEKVEELKKESKNSGKAKKGEKAQKEHPKEGEELVVAEAVKDLANQPEKEAKNGDDQPPVAHEIGATGKKKKGKKGNSGNGGGEAVPGEPPVAALPPSAPNTAPVGLMGPAAAFQPPYPVFSAAMDYVPVPLFGVSYNTNYPSNSGAYYASSFAPPPPPSYPVRHPSEDEYYYEEEGGCAIM